MLTLNDVQRAIATVDAEIGMRAKVFRDKPQTRQLKINEMQNVKEILQIVEKKMKSQMSLL